MSALCQIGNNNGKSLNYPVVTLSERNSAGRTGQPRTLWLRGAARKQRETRRRGRWNIRVQFHEWWWKIPSLEREANSLLGRGSRFRRRIRFNNRLVLCLQFFFIYLVMEQWDCRHLLSFVHLLTLLFVSLILTCLYWSVFGTWLKLNGRKSLPWLAYLICALKTSWMNDIVIFVKREKLTSDGDHPSWFRINHPNEEALLRLGNGPRQNCMIGIGIGWYKPSW